MPRKDGYETCEDIREWEQNLLLQNSVAAINDCKGRTRERQWRQLPIIALSADVLSDVEEKCLQCGFSDYVTKPIDYKDLIAAMAKFFTDPMPSP